MRRRFTNKSLKEEYLTITAINDAEVSFYRLSNIGDLYYRKGIGWRLYSEPLTLASGESVQFKGELRVLNVDYVEKGCGNFIINGECNISGYCTSILYGEEYEVNEINFSYSFYNLFTNCDIVDASNLILPATTLKKWCYSYMFSGCTSLTTAPELPAVTLVEHCYDHMFDGCTSLNYIKMLATDISATSCLSFWVSSVASSGTFIKNPDATWDVTGTSGVPEGWVVKFDGEEDASLISFSIDDVEYQAEREMTWREWVESEYNTGGFIREGIRIKKDYLYVGTVTGQVKTSDIIQEGVKYLLVF